MDTDIFILLSETRGVLRIDGNLSLLRELIASLGGSVIDEKGFIKMDGQNQKMSDARKNVHGYLTIDWIIRQRNKRTILVRGKNSAI